MTRNPQNIAIFNYTRLGVLNIFLAAIIIFLMIYYVIVSNIITASSYKVGLLNEELSGLLETNGLLTAQKLSIENSSAIFKFAHSQNMVEAGRISHIFESDEVAALR